jgi:hypothetical protein
MLATKKINNFSSHIQKDKISVPVIDKNKIFSMLSTVSPHEEMNTMQLGIYLHYKKKYYNVIHTNVMYKPSEHSSPIRYVLYQCLDNKYHCWLREYNDFVTPGKFTYVSIFEGIPLLNEIYETFSFDPSKDIIIKQLPSDYYLLTYATLLDDMHTCSVYLTSDNTSIALKEY